VLPSVHERSKNVFNEREKSLLWKDDTKDDDEDDGIPLSVAQARLIVRADAILRGAAGSAPAATQAPGASAPKTPAALHETESVRRTDREGDGSVGKFSRFGTADLADFAGLAEADHVAMRRQAATTLTNLARSFEAAGADAAIGGCFWTHTLAQMQEELPHVLLLKPRRIFRRLLRQDPHHRYIRLHRSRT
jgi:hypothetical protein